jgi:3-deoxy-D-manno-octulosonic-acid transferase
LADKQGIPVALINGRMTEKSYKGYRKLKSLMADVLRRIDPICVQGDVDAGRMIGVGAPVGHVHVMGTVKFDVAERNIEGEKIAAEIIQRVGVPSDAVVLLGGSTWPGEEAVLCDLYKKLKAEHDNLFLVLVPRHVERADEVIQCMVERNLTFQRRSQLDEIFPPETPDVLFIDTTGELRNFYSVAEIIFVGKSLLENGGQNPIEPAMCGKAVVVGPNMENFPAVMPVFLSHEALVQVADVAGFEAAVSHLLSDKEARSAFGARAAKVVEENRGMIQKTVHLLN